jgi:hypothetical protein
MLKIKDNIDLKALEKYGFVDEFKEYAFWHRLKKIWIRKEDRLLRFNSMNRVSFDVLYDMISDGIIEKKEWKSYPHRNPSMKDLKDEINELKKEIIRLKGK